MGKRELDEKTSHTRHAKRSKRHHRPERTHRSKTPHERKHHKRSEESPEAGEEKDISNDVPPPAINEEEIVFDAEVECVDVETEEYETENVTAMASTPIPKSPSPSATPVTPVRTSPKKSSSGGGSIKKSKGQSIASASSNSKAIPSTPPPSQNQPTTATSGPLSTPPTAGSSSNAKKSKRRRDSGTSSEEERWLTAIESGKLDDVDDELKKIKDPKLMTARQRAMYERSQPDKEPSPGRETLMSLPIGYREREKPQTAEDIQKAQLKSQKRKQQMDEKREKDKKKTMDRLLKKQESGKQRSAGRNKQSKASTAQPMITYRNTIEGSYILLPPEHEFPLQMQTAREPPTRQLCGIPDCGKPKAYNCSKTNVPLCSLECYRKNAQAVV